MSESADALANEQLRLIGRAREFIRKRALRHPRVTAIDPECYLNSWANVPGYLRLKKLALGWKAEPRRFIAASKDVVRLFRFSGFDVAGEGIDVPTITSVIVSWTRAQDLDAEGVHHDRYLRINSGETPASLWLLISLDVKTCPKLAENVLVLCGRVGATVGIRYAVAWLREFIGLTGKKEVGRKLSGTASYADCAAAVLRKQLDGKAIRHVVMPYEAQPFQHAMYLAAKELDGGIKTIGYMHSALPALPTDFIYRSGAPDVLLVHGRGQADILIRHLGWPAEKVKVIPSLRYRRDDPAPIAGHILLPYDFENLEAIVAAVEGYVSRAPLASMPKWRIRNHPVRANSAKHIELIDRLQAVVDAHSDRATESDAVCRQSLIIGATAAVVEALERGLEVVHVCSDPLFERHSSVIWEFFDVEILATNAYRYRLRESESYIRLGEASAAAALGHLLESEPA